MLTNAHHILIESIELGGLDTFRPDTRTISMDDIPDCNYFFYCRTRDLARQAISMCRECSIDHFFRKAASENIDAIHQQLSMR